MKKAPPRARGGLKRLLARSLFAGTGIVVAPSPALAESPAGHEVADARADDRDDIAAADDADDHDHDHDEAHADAAGRRLAARLATMSPFDATRSAALAALSPRPRIRRTIAAALAQAFPLVGDDLVVEHLARDPDLAVRLAAIRAGVARGMPLPAPPVATDPPRAPRVLVIDDYPGGRAALCACLTDMGCDAMWAPTTIARRDVAWHDVVDVVITNHEPPWLDGARLVTDLRRRAPALPAIVLMYASAPRPRLDDEPAHITITKPAALDELAVAIHALAPNTRPPW